MSQRFRMLRGKGITFKRFILLQAGILALLLAGLGAWTVQQGRLAKEERPTIIAGPYLQEAGPRGMTISWETDWRGERGRVDFGPTSRYGGVSEKEGDYTPCQSVIHHHRLSGLRPATLYHYRVSSGGASSADHTFRTAPEGRDAPFDAVVYSDSRAALGGYKTAHPEVVRSIIEHSSADIVIITGDMADNGGFCRGWESHHGWKQEFFDPAAPLISETPLFTVPGNHEYYASPAPHLIVDPPVLYLTYFDPGRRNTTYYDFSYGCARFIAIDSNINTRAGDFSPGSRQYAWIEKQLGRHDPRWTIVLLHHPPFASRKTYGVCRAVREHLVPLFEKYRVPLVFGGHNHIYERSLKDGVTYITSGGGGEPLYKDDRPDLNPYRVFSRSVYQHCHVNATPDALTVTAKDNDGAVIDRLTIEREYFFSPQRRKDRGNKMKAD